MTWNLPSSVGKMFPGTHEGWKGAQPTPRQIPAVPPKANATSPCFGGLVNAALNANSPFQQNSQGTWDLGTSDMVMRCTANAWGINAGCYYMVLARDDGSQAVAYTFRIEGTGGPNATYTLWVPDEFTTQLDTVTLPKPIAGDVLECSAVGSSIEGKKNGITIVSATDATITVGQFGAVRIFDGVSVTDIEVDVFCP